MLRILQQLPISQRAEAKVLVMAHEDLRVTSLDSPTELPFAFLGPYRSSNQRGAMVLP